MQVEVDTTVPAPYYIDRTALIHSIEEAYQTGGVAISSSSDATGASWKISHKRTFLPTGTYGDGYCYVAIATYITRKHRTFEAPVPDGIFQDLAWQKGALLYHLSPSHRLN